MTLRHVGMLRFVKGTTPEQRQAVVDGLRELPSRIPEIRRYQVGTDLGLGADNFHVALVGDFDDRAGYETYRDHPVHRSLIAERIEPVLEQRAAVQFEVDD